MSLISILRLVALGISLFFGIVVTGLSANRVAFHGAYVYPFMVLSIVAGVFTMLIIPILLILAIFRRGAFVSMIVVELPCLALLWILWLANAALTASNGGSPSNCLTTWCQQYYAIEALSFLIWIALFGYSAVLLTLALIAQNAGNDVWKVGVNEAVFFARPGNGPAAVSKEAFYSKGASTPVLQSTQVPPGSILMTPQTTVSTPPSFPTTPAYPQV